GIGVGPGGVGRGFAPGRRVGVGVAPPPVTGACDAPGCPLAAGIDVSGLVVSPLVPAFVKTAVGASVSPATIWFGFDGGGRSSTAPMRRAPTPGPTRTGTRPNRRRAGGATTAARTGAGRDRIVAVAIDVDFGDGTGVAARAAASRSETAESIGG